jgi:hypothetical protein
MGCSGEEFEVAYAARSGCSVAELRAAGRIVVPCSCGLDGCEGWMSVSGADFAADRMEERGER